MSMIGSRKTTSFLVIIASVIVATSSGSYSPLKPDRKPTATLHVALSATERSAAERSGVERDHTRQTLHRNDQG